MKKGLKDYIRNYKAVIGRRGKLTAHDRAVVRAGPRLITPRDVMLRDFIAHRVAPRMGGSRLRRKGQGRGPFSVLAQAGAIEYAHASALAQEKLRTLAANWRSEAARKGWLTRRRHSG